MKNEEFPVHHSLMPMYICHSERSPQGVVEESHKASAIFPHPQSKHLLLAFH